MEKAGDLGYNKEIKMKNDNGEFLTITEAARLVGVSSKTIVRWEKSGKVRRSKRDFRGWRVFDEKDLKKLRAFKETIFYLFISSFFWCVSVQAFDLQAVDQDKQSAAAEQPAQTAQSTQEAAQTQPEFKSEAPVETNNGARIFKAKDDEIFVSTQNKKVMPPPPDIKKIAIGEPTRYTLGPDDIIEIDVRRHPEFSGKYLINGEGKIQYKFIGDIDVVALTKSEVKDKIIKILSKFIISPDVDVMIAEYRSKIIYVIGEVGAPGKYYMKADTVSLREAVVQAGLPTLSAAMRRTQLIRPDKSGKPKEKSVDLYALLYEGKLNLDQDMFPGDVLVVPATVFAKIMRVINPVAQPVYMGADAARRVQTGGI